MSNRRRANLPLLALVCAAISIAACLAGCSGLGGVAPKDAAKVALTSQLDAVKNADATQVESLIGSDTYTELQNYNVDVQSFYSSLVSRFSYEVKDVSVDSSGNSATATISATNIDLNQVFSGWMTEFETYALSSEGLGLLMSGDDTTLTSKGMQMLATDLAKSDNPTTTGDVTVDLTKGSDGTWSLADDDLSNILFVGQSLKDMNGALSSDTSDSGSTSATTTVAI